VADAASSRSRPDEALGPHVVLVVGRMLASERYKGHDELLDAWPLVASRVPDARLVFVGDGDDIARLRAKADDLGVASSVTLTGFLDDARLRSVYRSAAVFAMPSRDEGFGLVYLEAMAYGVPCIGSPHDAAGDVIEDQVSGYLISPDDTATLAARLVDLLTDEHRRHAMGEAGRRRVREHFGYSRFRDGLLTLLDDALGERQRSRQQTRARADSHVT
jgi:phosphatidylinositol alpha-1,6-mannosyltransferase